MEKLNYTKGPWVKALYGLQGVMSGKDDIKEKYKLIARFDQIIDRTEEAKKEEENNMLLTMEAVNTCIDLNPDNPLEAAKGLRKAIAALREAKIQLEYLNGQQRRGTTNSVLNQIEIALSPFKD